MQIISNTFKVNFNTHHLLFCNRNKIKLNASYVVFQFLYRLIEKIYSKILSFDNVPFSGSPLGAAIAAVTLAAVSACFFQTSTIFSYFPIQSLAVASI